MLLSFSEKIMTDLSNHLLHQVHKEVEQQERERDRPLPPEASNQLPEREDEGEHMQVSRARENSADEQMTKSSEIRLQPVATEEELKPQEFIRSEVNLLNLPFFALWDKDVRKRSETNYKAVVERGGERLEISWTVAAHQRYGYPGPFDRKVHRAVEQIISSMRPPIANPIANDIAPPSAIVLRSLRSF